MAWTAQGTRPLRVLTGSPWPPPAALVESALTLGIPIPDTEAESKVPSTALAVSVEVCLCLRVFALPCNNLFVRVCSFGRFSPDARCDSMCKNT